MNWLSFLPSKETLLSVRWELLTFSLYYVSFSFMKISLRFTCTYAWFAFDFCSSFLGFGSWASAISLKSFFSIFHSQFHYVQNYGRGVCASSISLPSSGWATLSRSCRAKIRPADWSISPKNVFSTFFVFQVFGRERERKCPIQTQRLGRGATNFGIFVFSEKKAKDRKVAIFRSVTIDTFLSCHELWILLMKQFITYKQTLVFCESFYFLSGQFTFIRHCIVVSGFDWS